MYMTYWKGKDQKEAVYGAWRREAQGLEALHGDEIFLHLMR